MDFVEKRPGSWRLDYQDFREVYKGSFTQGVITEFQKTNDDPITVLPMVKVKIPSLNLESADYIPIFFCPKNQYWDGSNFSSRDFNQDNGFYKASYMSFRADDPVIVLLEYQNGDLKPLFVIGFADRVPRIGEDIIKFTGDMDSPYYARCSQHGLIYSEGENGPDGLDLMLKKQGDCILYQKQNVPGPTTTLPKYRQQGLFSMTPNAIECDLVPGAWAPATVHIDYIYADYIIEDSFMVTVGHYLIAVGPILYLIELWWASESTRSYNNIGSYSGQDCLWNSVFPDIMAEAVAAYQRGEDPNVF